MDMHASLVSLPLAAPALLGPADAAWPFATALMKALADCHARGVIHRDVKLENIMLCAEDPAAVRLIDFGLATRVALQEDGTVKREDWLTDSAGTQAYRAPEVTSKLYDPLKVDVWAAGIVLFALVAGFFPIQEAKDDDWRFKRIAEAQAKGYSPIDAIFKMYRRPCKFSMNLRNLLDRMLRVNPDDRITMAEAAESTWCTVSPEPEEGDSRVDGLRYRSVSASGQHCVEDLVPEDAVPITRQRAVRGD